jgi:hypothetical protein
MQDAAGMGMRERIQERGEDALDATPRQPS